MTKVECSLCKMVFDMAVPEWLDVKKKHSDWHKNTSGNIIRGNTKWVKVWE